ncbi:premnaspirodiene oxygenase-like [Aristolochia californica]|uniref:premnaspirodiene oxygenase-like n=1 Tax=Aristolochia californica TaxID=171875 RepID=UPI0035DA8E3E
MELHLPSILLLVSCILFLFVRKAKRPAAGSKLPPGPRKLPIIGNIHNVVGSLPQKVLRDLAQKYGPLMHLRLGQLSVVVVSSPDIAKEMLKTHDLNFSQRPDMICTKIISYGYADLVFAPYGDLWRQLRKICILEILSAKRVQSFDKIREEETTNLVQFISSIAGSPINLSKKLFILSIDIIARCIFGDRCDDQDGFKMTLEENIKFLGVFNVADLFPSSRWICVLSRTESKFQKTHRKLDKIVSNIIEAHQEKMRTRKDEGRDQVEYLVDVLLRLQKHGDLQFELTLDNIKGVIFDMFAAGTETSSTTMIWAMSHLMKNPRVMQKAQQEVRSILRGKDTITEDDITQMNYLKLVIRETLRLCPPLPFLVPRESIDDCQICGYEIPKKSRVLVNIWAIGRDPKYWKNPNDFEPERFLGSSMDFRGQNFELIPFGAGRRGCPGMLFGLVTIERALASLLYHFDWKLPDGTKDLDMSEASGITMAKKSNLRVIATPCK